MSIASIIQETTGKDFYSNFSSVKKFFLKAYLCLKNKGETPLTEEQYKKCFENIKKYIFELSSNKKYLFSTEAPKEIEDKKEYTWKKFEEFIVNYYENKNMPKDFPVDMQKHGYENGYKTRVYVYDFYDNSKQLASQAKANKDRFCKNYSKDVNDLYIIYYSLEDGIVVDYMNEYEGPYSRLYNLCSLFLKAFTEKDSKIVDSYLYDFFYETILEKYRTRGINDSIMDKYELGEIFRAVPKTYEKLNSFGGKLNLNKTMDYSTTPFIIFNGIRSNEDKTTSFFIKKSNIPEYLKGIITISEGTLLEDYKKTLASMSNAQKNSTYPFGYMEIIDGESNHVNYDIIDESGKKIRYGERTYKQYYDNEINYLENYKSEQIINFINSKICFVKPVITEKLDSAAPSSEKSYLAKINKELKVINASYNFDKEELELVVDLDTYTESSPEYIKLSWATKSGYLITGRLQQKLIDNNVSNINSSNLVNFYMVKEVGNIKNPNTRYDAIEYNSLMDDRDVNIYSFVGEQEKTSEDATVTGRRKYVLEGNKLKKDSQLDGINSIGIIYEGETIFSAIEKEDEEYLFLRENININGNVELYCYTKGKKAIYTDKKVEEDNIFNNSDWVFEAFKRA